MTKYSKEFKLMVVRDYRESDVSCSVLAKKYGVKSASNIRNWIDNYEAFGPNSLRNKKRVTYSKEFKVSVLEYRKQTNENLSEISKKFGILNPSLITAWQKKYDTQGIEGMSYNKKTPLLSEKSKLIQKNNELELENISLLIQVICLKIHIMQDK